MDYFPTLNWNSTRHRLLLTAPHSGETIPPEAAWLNTIPSSILLIDPDRFVNELYGPAAHAHDLPFLFTHVHRYAADLNRYPLDIDQASVQGATNPAGKFTHGFHWVKTTQGHTLLERPITPETHQAIVHHYHDPFHRLIEDKLFDLRAAHPGKKLYHLDLHTMPSRGNESHTDNGRMRAQVVLSDCEGKSALRPYFDLVREAILAQGFELAINDPYKGGRITQRYGKPETGIETLQIELNRAIYMDEDTRERSADFEKIREKLTSMIKLITDGILSLP